MQGLDLLSTLSNIKPSQCRTAFQAPSELFTSLDAIATTLHAKAGDCVFREAVLCTGIYLVRSGRVRALSSLSSLKNGRGIVDRIVGPGAILALPSAMCSRAFQFSAEAIEPSEIGFIETRSLNEFLRASPMMCMQVLGMMSDELIELRETRDHMKNCSNKDCSLHGSCSCAT